LTLGCKGESWPFAGSIDAAESLGNKCVEMNVNQVCYDSGLRMFTSPAYMNNDAEP